MRKKKSKNTFSDKKWEVLASLGKEADYKGIVNKLLENRGLKTSKEKTDFLDPRKPNDITLKEFGLKSEDVSKAIKRIEKAIKGKERIIIYGDYDADGICATAIIWETLYKLGANVLPYIPERFSEGYGLNIESLKALNNGKEDIGLVITVDNGITAFDEVKEASKMGIDVIITDHHLVGKKKPKAFGLIHTTQVSGSAVSWIFSREIKKKIKKIKRVTDGLELVAIGTISDQIPLLGVNRSLVKYGLEELNETKRPGLKALIKDSGIKEGEISTYTVGFVIAPRLNAMGRLEHAIDSLRLVCTTNRQRAKKLARSLGRTNTERQRIVEEVVVHARGLAGKKDWQGVILVSDESYHEGVIGLAASKLVEEFYRPAIVVSRGKKLSKASARSIAGFNIIEAIRQFEDMLVSGGGHPMAAGFSINTSSLESFIKKLNKFSTPLLTEEVLKKSLKIDLGIEFGHINQRLYEQLERFEPTGNANYTPTFVTRNVKVLKARGVGKKMSHLKMMITKEGKIFDGIAFNFGPLSSKLSQDEFVDIVYSIDENHWNGRTNLELMIKDIKKSKINEN